MTGKVDICNNKDNILNFTGPAAIFHKLTASVPKYLTQAS